MNTGVTSKEDILKISREIVQNQGFEAINIRSIACACDISVGSIYNHFNSKAELMSAVVEDVWADIFHHWEDTFVFQDMEVCIRWIYGRLKYGSKRYPGFFKLHSLGFLQENRTEGKMLMQKTWSHILDSLCYIVKKDDKVKPDAFDENFTAEKFADVLFSLIVSSILREDYDESTVLILLRKILY